MVRKLRRTHAEALRLRLIVAVSGVTASVAACAGRSEKNDDNGGASGSAGASASGGASTGGSGGSQGGSVSTGGSGAKGGNSGKGGTGNGGTGTGGSVAGTGAIPMAGIGGTGASGGVPNGGQGNVKPHGCVPVDADGTNLPELCEGTYVHHPANAECVLSPHPTAQGGAGNAGGAGGEGGASDEVPPSPPEFRYCSSDADCSAKADGYCVREDYGQEIQIQCIYACHKDSDCGPDELCSCEAGYESEVSRKPLSLGVCKPTTCQNDEACGPGLLCISPVQSPCGPARPGMFHCQTPDDLCGGPGDCTAAKGSCTYNGTRHECQAFPICGRPFLVEGALRQGALVDGECATDASWVEASVAGEALGAISPAVREAVAAHWARAGLMEHASVAAFARFALQLMALGAPAELVEATTQAMADETRHAKLCFGLATRYSGRATGPGPLDVTGALGAVTLGEVVELVIEEGCIGETGAALEAAWAAEAATDPVVRDVLRGIAEDEARHAELAWRFVAWAASRDGGVTARVEARVRAALARLTLPEENEGEGVRFALEAHGVLGASGRAEARRAALAQVLPDVMSRLAA